LLIILLSAVAKAMADKFELPILTFCTTTQVLYQILDKRKGKYKNKKEKMQTADSTHG
jgi:hypothetical protein